MQPNILVVRLSSLGDIVLTLPVYKNLKAHWPKCRISVLVKPQYIPLLRGNPCVDEVIAFRGLWSAIARARRGGFTHLLDLHSTFRSRMIAAFSVIPNKLRYHKDALARRLFVGLRLTSPSLAKHTIDRYLESLRQWGVPTPLRDIRIEDYAPDSERLPAPKRALIVQTAFLGDATLTLPLAAELKKLAKDCRVTVLARPDTAEIFRKSPWIDETLSDDKRGRYAGPRGLFRLARTLRERSFDLALVPHRSLRFALAVWLARIPVRIGFSSSAGRFLLTRAIPFTWGMRDLERNLGLLLPFHSPRPAADDVSLYLNARPWDGQSPLARRLAAAGAADAPLIGIHPGSVWPTKRWPAERYARLVHRLLSETKASVLLVGGPNDSEIAAQIVSLGLPEARFRGRLLDWCGKTTLDELIELMPRLSLFITNDSGPMHLAAASGVPTLAIFGPTTRELGFFPYGPAHRVIEADLACRPCGLHGAKACPQGHFLCMRLLSVQQVFDAATGMLQSKRPASTAALPR